MSMIDQGPFLGYALSKHPTFQKENATQKVATVKGSRKKKGKGEQTKPRTDNGKKSPNFA